jgi:hypothetical protein
VEEIAQNRNLAQKIAIVVPRAGIEPALLAELDFESTVPNSNCNGGISLGSFSLSYDGVNERGGGNQMNRPTVLTKSP